jgi:DNA-binding GntR family transcriptional regulator
MPMHRTRETWPEMAGVLLSPIEIVTILSTDPFHFIESVRQAHARSGVMKPRLRRTKRSAAAGATPRGALVGQAFERLRDLIVTGRIAPGALIIETETAAQLGVQRSHLRLALLRLAQMGFVETTARGAYSRTRVTPLTMDDAVELFSVVGALEGIAARAAAALPEPAREALASDLTRINADLLAASRAKPPAYQRTNDLDLAFHRCYVERAGGPRVRTLYDSVKPQADRYERLYTSALLDQIALSVAEHAAIIAAIAKGDADAAERAAEMNWRNAAERLRAVIATSGERGRL